MNRKLKIAIIVVLVLILAYTAFYFTEYRHAEKKATDLMNGAENVSVIKENYGLFLNGSGNDTLFIFYPGAKNEYVSYLPLLVKPEIATTGAVLSTTKWILASFTSRNALLSALSYKVANEKLIAVDSISLNEIKTKNFVQVLEALNACGKTLFVLPEVTENVERSSRNIPNVSVNVANHVSVYDVLNSDKVVVALDSIKYFEEVLK